jgi:hypothetical protein
MSNIKNKLTTIQDFFFFMKLCQQFQCDCTWSGHANVHTLDSAMRLCCCVILNALDSKWFMVVKELVKNIILVCSDSLNIEKKKKALLE